VEQDAVIGGSHVSGSHIVYGSLMRQSNGSAGTHSDSGTYAHLLPQGTDPNAYLDTMSVEQLERYVSDLGLALANAATRFEHGDLDDPASSYTDDEVANGYAPMPGVELPGQDVALLTGKLAAAKEALTARRLEVSAQEAWAEGEQLFAVSLDGMDAQALSTHRTALAGLVQWIYDQRLLDNAPASWDVPTLVQDLNARLSLVDRCIRALHYGDVARAAGARQQQQTNALTSAYRAWRQDRGDGSLG
jgi:hypothetical protein